MFFIKVAPCRECGERVRVREYDGSWHELRENRHLEKCIHWSTDDLGPLRGEGQ